MCGHVRACLWSPNCYTSHNSPRALPLNRGRWLIFERCQVRTSFRRFPQPILINSRTVPQIADPGAVSSLRCTGLDLSLAGTAGSNPARGTVVCLLWMLRFVGQRHLRRVYPSTRSPTECHVSVLSWTFDNEEVLRPLAADVPQKTLPQIMQKTLPPTHHPIIIH